MKCNWKYFCNICIACCLYATTSNAEHGIFDLERWNNILYDIRLRAESQNIKQSVIDETLTNAVFIPKIIYSDKNQTEFTLNLNQYLKRTVSQNKISNGKKMRSKYPTLLSQVSKKYDIPSNVLLSFWGMESDYGKIKSKYQLNNAFLTLIYDGRREDFFKKQLLALMNISSKNKLAIQNIRGSWAGAMGHFQFIPTTLIQYGVDGNKDGRIDIINDISDAMYSAGNYLHTLGWNSKERIIRRVIVPANFERSLLNGDTKKTLIEWAEMGITNPDGSPIPTTNITAGLIADTKEIAKQDLYYKQFANMIEKDTDIDIEPAPMIEAFLTYPNFYRIKKWNNSSWYAIAIAELADKIK